MSPPAGRRIAWLVVAAGLVLAWRFLALVPPFGPGAGQSAPRLVELLLTGLGVSFVVLGLLVYARLGGKVACLFAVFCLCSGLHWGGPLEGALGELRIGLLYFYLVVSGILAQAVFLHLGLSFPRRTAVGGSLRAVRWLYLPVVAAAALAAAAWIAPGGGDLRGVAQSVLLILHSVVSNLYPAAVLALYLFWWVRPGLSRAEKTFVAVMVAGMLLAWVPYLLAPALGLDTDWSNLTMIALPLSFAVALLGIARPRGAQMPA